MPPCLRDEDADSWWRSAQDSDDAHLVRESRRDVRERGSQQDVDDVVGEVIAGPEDGAAR